MGVVNVTPDSFSDGGLFSTTDEAITRGLELAADGADIVDVGGESTRPGASRISVDEECSRVLPVVRALSEHGVCVSIDTMRGEVAAAAVEAGAAIINDISGGKSDPLMLPVVAATTVPYVLMHWRGPSDIMQTLTNYDNVAFDVADEIALQVDAVITAGVRRERIAIDPGIGFAKTPDQNWPILRELEQLDAIGLPVLWGVSRKRFLGELLADEAGNLREMSGRESATTALSMYLALAGAWCVRVHEARGSRDAVEVAARLCEES
jgi:dihydropteroate synthase